MPLAAEPLARGPCYRVTLLLIKINTIHGSRTSARMTEAASTASLGELVGRSTSCAHPPVRLRCPGSLTMPMTFANSVKCC